MVQVYHTVNILNMKKALLIAILLLLPVSTFAQTTEPLKEQLIALLMEQVNFLQIQLADLLEQQEKDKLEKERTVEEKVQADAEFKKTILLQEQESARIQKVKLDAIEHQGFYKECFYNDGETTCVYWVSMGCWSETGPFGLRQCGG